MDNKKEKSIFSRLRLYVEDRFRLITYTIVSGIFILWIASNFFKPLADFIENNTQILMILMLAFMAESLSILIDIKNVSLQKAFCLVSDQLEATEEIITFIKQRPPRTADFIEASTASINEILEALSKSNCNIRILMQNPNSAINSYQKKRMEQRVFDLANLMFKDYPCCQIRLYSTPPSIRGRVFDNDYVTVGWYTYSNDSIGFYGHTNPLVMAHGDLKEAHLLRKMFMQAFTSLWEHPKSINISDYLQEKKW